MRHEILFKLSEEIQSQKQQKKKTNTQKSKEKKFEGKVREKG